MGKEPKRGKRGRRRGRWAETKKIIQQGKDKEKHKRRQEKKIKKKKNQEKKRIRTNKSQNKRRKSTREKGPRIGWGISEVPGATSFVAADEEIQRRKLDPPEKGKQGIRGNRKKREIGK